MGDREGIILRPIRGGHAEGVEVAEYLRRDPRVITTYLKERRRSEDEAEKVHEALRNISKVNKQV
jgi:hypothetical protein